MRERRTWVDKNARTAYLSVVCERIQVFFEPEKAVSSVDVNSFLVFFRVNRFVEQGDCLLVCTLVVALNIYGGGK